MKTLLLLLVALCAAPSLSQVTPSPVNPLPVSGQCQLAGYDLHRLTSVDHWTFSVKNNETWVIPDSINKNDVSSVTISMSLCKPLPEGNCKANVNSTICEHITLKNGDKIDVDMSSFNKNDKFVPLEDNKNTPIDGFFIEQRSQNIINSTFCKSSSLTTVLAFECDLNAKWTSTDVTSHLSTFEPLFGCASEIVFKYNGSCYIPPTLSPSNCQLDGYDLSGLAKQPFWYARVPHTVCFNGTQDNECTVFFSFCHALPEEGTSNFNLRKCISENAAVCQIGMNKNDGSAAEYSMGEYKESTRFHANNSTLGGFHIEMSNGSRPENGTGRCSKALNTRIIIGCNSSVNWPENGDVTDLILPIYDEFCQYTFELQYAGACLKVFPQAEPVSPVGWIFIGLFLFAVTVYLVVGMSYQYFVKGARGADVVPHYTFWAKAGSLVVEGCKYTLDIVTCSQLRRSQGGFSHPKGSASGVQYDQI